MGNTDIEVTPDNNYLFVSQEDGPLTEESVGGIDVFRLSPPATNGSISGELAGYISLGNSVVGTTLSSDGGLLYATSDLALNSTTQQVTTPQGRYIEGQGSLNVLGLKTLTTDPSNALLSNVTAGCGAIRVEVSPTDGTVWVSARESNHILAYDPDLLQSDPDNALIASVQVGTSPVGIIFA